MVTELTVKFQDALVYGTELHAGQPRKGTDIPYVSHLLAVSSIVMENGGDEDEVIAAFLHDAAEDKGGREVLDDIQTKFGKKVADIVAGCTDAWTKPKPEWRERKEQYLAHLNEGVSTSVLLVSCADKLHNARSILSDYRRIGESLWKRFKGGKDGTLWYYRSLIDAYQHLNANSNIVDELNRVVTELETLSKKC